MSYLIVGYLPWDKFLGMSSLASNTSAPASAGHIEPWDLKRPPLLVVTPITQWSPGMHLDLPFYVLPISNDQLRVPFPILTLQEDIEEIYWRWEYRCDGDDSTNRVKFSDKIVLAAVRGLQHQDVLCASILEAISAAKESGSKLQIKNRGQDPGHLITAKDITRDDKEQDMIGDVSGSNASRASALGLDRTKAAHEVATDNVPNQQLELTQSEKELQAPNTFKRLPEFLEEHARQSLHRKKQAITFKGWALKDEMSDREPFEIITARSTSGMSFTAAIDNSLRKRKSEKQTYRQSMQYTEEETSPPGPGKMSYLIVGYISRNRPDHIAVQPAHPASRGIVGHHRVHHGVEKWKSERPPIPVVVALPNRIVTHFMLYALLTPKKGLCTPYEIRREMKMAIYWRWEFRSDETSIQRRSQWTQAFIVDAIKKLQHHRGVIYSRPRKTPMRT